MSGVKEIRYKTHCNRTYGATSARFRWQWITAGYRADGFLTFKSSTRLASACGAAVRVPSRSLRMRLVQMVHARSSTAAYLQEEIIVGVQLTHYTSINIAIRYL